MGWGLLFFGYFLEFLLGINESIGAFIHLIGRGFMLVGVAALERYLRLFSRVRYTLYAYLCLSLPITVYGVGRVLGFSVSFLTDSVMNVIRWSDLVVMLILHVFLAFAVKELALRVSLPKNAMRALRNLILTGLYALLYVICRILQSGEVVAILFAAATLLRVLYVILNCVLLYSCYMHIAPAGGESMERAPSRFAFINRLRRAFDEKEQKAIDADRAWHAERAKKAQEKRMARMSRKQREKQESRTRTPKK